MTVDMMARLVAGEVFGDTTVRCLAATPCEGAAGTTFRLAFEGGGLERTLYVKLPTQSVERHALFAARLREEFRVTSEVERAFPASRDLQTVVPARFVEAVQGLATWASPGIALEGVLRERCLRIGGPIDDARAWCVKAAEWLNAFHRLPSPYGAAEARARLDTYYDDRLVTLANLPGSGVSDRLAADLKTSLMQMVDAELARTPVVLCHNDYSPHNMLVHGTGLCVLDYSFAGPGLPTFDMACFWHKLDDIQASPINAPRRVAALQDAFIEASGTPFDLGAPAVTLGFARLVLSKMISRQRLLRDRPELRWMPSRRYAKWLSWLHSGYDPRYLRA